MYMGVYVSGMLNIKIIIRGESAILNVNILFEQFSVHNCCVSNILWASTRYHYIIFSRGSSRYNMNQSHHTLL